LEEYVKPSRIRQIKLSME